MAGGAGDTLPPTGTSFARSCRVPARNRREQGRQGPGSLSGPRPPWGGERLRPKSDTLHRVFLGCPLLPGRKGGLTILEMEEESPWTATQDRPGQAWAWSGHQTPTGAGAGGVGRKARPPLAGRSPGRVPPPSPPTEAALGLASPAGQGHLLPKAEPRTASALGAPARWPRHVSRSHWELRQGPSQSPNSRGQCREGRVSGTSRRASR